MASFNLGAKAFLSEASEARNEQPLRAYLATLTQLGYYAIDWHQEEGRTPELLEAMDPDNQHMTPGLSPRLDQEIRDFAAGTMPSVDPFGKYGPYDPKDDPNDSMDPQALEVGVFATRVDPTLGHVKLWLMCAPGKGWLRLGTDSKNFDNKPNHPRWMELVDALYDTWRPRYISPFYLAGEPYHSRQEVLAGQIKWLYRDFNYFGSDLVNQLGREWLLNTPGVRVQELKDGGVSLGPGDSEQAAKYLKWSISI